MGKELGLPTEKPISASPTRDRFLMVTSQSLCPQMRLIAKTKALFVWDVSVFTIKAQCRGCITAVLQTTEGYDEKKLSEKEVFYTSYNLNDFYKG